MNNDGTSDEELRELSEQIVGYLDPRLFSKEIQHLTREIETLADLRKRIDLARTVLNAGGPNAARLTLMALDGASIDQIMREATTPGETR